MSIDFVIMNKVNKKNQALVILELTSYLWETDNKPVNVVVIWIHTGQERKMQQRWRGAGDQAVWPGRGNGLKAAGGGQLGVRGRRGSGWGNTEPGTWRPGTGHRGLRDQGRGWDLGSCNRRRMRRSLKISRGKGMGYDGQSEP